MVRKQGADQGREIRGIKPILVTWIDRVPKMEASTMAMRRTPPELLRDAAKDTAGAHMGMAKAALKENKFTQARGYLQKALTAVNEAPKSFFDEEDAEAPADGNGTRVGVGT